MQESLKAVEAPVQKAVQKAFEKAVQKAAPQLGVKGPLE